MPKNFFPKSATLALALSGAALSAQAATVQYQLEATATDTNDLASGFSIIFDDLDMDMLFSLDELVSFSGVTAFNVVGDDVFMPTLWLLPETTGFTDGGNDRWGFGFFDGNLFRGRNVGSDQYTYVLSPVPSPVPLPAGGLLLLTGLAGCAVLRRRRT